MKYFIFIKNIFFSIQSTSIILSILFLLFSKNPLIDYNIEEYTTSFLFNLPVIFSFIALFIIFKTKIIFTFETTNKIFNSYYIILVCFLYFCIFYNKYSFFIYLFLILFSFSTFSVSLFSMKLKNSIYGDEWLFSKLIITEHKQEPEIYFNSSNKNISYFSNYVVFYNYKIPLSIILEFEKTYGKKLVDFNELEIETLKMYSIS